MKIGGSQLLLWSTIVIFSACKKNDAPVLKNEKPQQLEVSAVTINAIQAPLTVLTLAGSSTSRENGYQDGPGAQALFNNPQGMDMLEDGTIYIADNGNNKIRKISPRNIVSTVTIPQSSDGKTMLQPLAVRVAKDGTINILVAESPLNPKHKVWILKPNGQLITPAYHSTDDHYYDIEKDPYNDYMWFCGAAPVYSDTHVLTGYIGDVEKFILNAGGNIGIDRYHPPGDSLTTADKQAPFFSTFYCGYNGVKYLAISKNIYKLTSSGEFTRINRDVFSGYIYSIVATRDSRTLYIIADAAIYSLSNGVVKYLVGPHYNLNGKDGVGKDADVSARCLALSKDESSLYFTDFLNHSVRRLFLK
ncbi:NHL repeat-containing protein [Mucilaginibacter agri]|uniref:NHL repeat-containing protein n=1 Tax=Mucilaginibacter agri TaxID=2695265 RepID=A0A965ZJJ8_9SPHI|nr:hypothetical protein [Mucilaginibacter agri]NCD71232.1 hypothetical protein [Mucilaginibacter agri]